MAKKKEKQEPKHSPDVSRSNGAGVDKGTRTRRHRPAAEDVQCPSGCRRRRGRRSTASACSARSPACSARSGEMKFRYCCSMPAADVLLWRNKKTSSSVLVGATLWVLFEWIDHRFLTLSMLWISYWNGDSVSLVQCFWSTSSEVPQIVLPKELFVNVAVADGAQVNQFLGFIQDVACRRNVKQFVMVLSCLLAAAVIGTWCNFLTVLY